MKIRIRKPLMAKSKPLTLPLNLPSNFPSNFPLNLPLPAWASIREGDLLTCDATYIVHQTNCVTECGKGLSKALFEKFPHANVYAQRTTRSVPGTVVILGDGETERFVVNLMGQVFPGGPKEYESKEKRERWFCSGLERLASVILKTPQDTTIAFPFRIGCGLAKGGWKRYKKMIDQFADIVKPRVVYVVKPPSSKSVKKRKVYD